MATFLHPRLVNGPAGDPGLLVDLAEQRRAVLFDLGRCDALDPAEALRVTDVFVTHTHIDHFIGFDTLLRWHLARPTHLRLHGPPPLLANVAGRLQGYTWNLVTESSPVVEVIEVDAQGCPARAQRFACARQFVPEPVESRGGDAVLAEDDLVVTAATCDHHNGTSVAWRLQERTRFHADAEALATLGGPPGPWISALKAAARALAEPDTPIPTPRGPLPFRAFVEAGALRSSPGDSLAYVTDVAWTPANRARLERLCAGVDVLYCEGGFLEADAAHARRVSHLTAANAGTLARSAGARELRTFHFSRRYHPDFDPLRAEAAAAFGLSG